MKNTLILNLALLILSSCATAPGGKPQIQGTSLVERKASPESKTEVKADALFHVVDPLNVKLVVLNLDKNVEETILLDKIMTGATLSSGFWKVSGFVISGVRYNTMNTSKQFIFQVKKSSTYVGSYIFQCPKVGTSYLPQMKKMAFFNRYPFSSEKRLCELVVGNDYPEVEKSQQRKLAIGF